MEARTPIDSITTAPVPATVPATTISAGSYISGANYRPRVGVAAAAAVASAATPTADDDGGGAGGFAATVTGCVRSSENAHWKYRMLATGFRPFTTGFRQHSHGMFDVRYFSRFGGFRIDFYASVIGHGIRRFRFSFGYFGLCRFTGCDHFFEIDHYH